MLEPGQPLDVYKRQEPAEVSHGEDELGNHVIQCDRNPRHERLHATITTVSYTHLRHLAAAPFVIERRDEIEDAR